MNRAATLAAASTLSLTALLSLAACSSGIAPAQVYGGPANDTPTATSSASSAPAGPPSEADVAAGHTIFVRACGQCHDSAAKTYSFVKPLDDVKMAEAALKKKIREGSGPPGDSPRMPAIGTDVLADSDMPALFAYLRSIHAVSP
jgi:mono/diheme cytochrome c family protein